MLNNCPRCGESLERFSLGGTATISCQVCGYAGIDADHSGEPTAQESWDEALRRFEANN